ncbi:hypothetical protein BC828DRAFT_377262 [Blastocladiella britannica]|nr:hypothetical protein BC828DRAFT_377262 [Blastocladiella britannica]
MSTLDKLLIRGIRSFGADTAYVVEIYTPLTLILGANGCGKTTIIECLKYITTGSLPPNSKGGAFVHDPKVEGEVETKAQVKLKFRNVNGKQMVCTRSLQLTLKEKTQTMKTIENLLEVYDEATGERQSLSGKCASLDTELPIHLGVSKAVLENVIFVHQEESNWPLAEPKVLKDKFDDIFASTRWTKALEELTKQKKKREVDLRTDRANLELRKERRARYLALESQRQVTARRLEAVHDRMQEIDTESARLMAEIDALLPAMRQGQALATELAGVRETRRVLLEVQVETKNRIVQLIDDDDDDTLRAALESHRASVMHSSQSLTSIQARIDMLAAERATLAESMSWNLTQKGGLARELERLEQLKAMRRDLAAVLVADMPFAAAAAGMPRPPDESLRPMLAERLREAEHAVQDARSKHSGIIAGLQTELTAAQTREQVAKQRQEEAAMVVTRDSHLMSAKQKDLDRLALEQADMATLQEQVEDITKEVTEKQAQLRTRTEAQQQTRLRRALEELDAQIRMANEELQMASRDAEHRAQLAAREKDAAARAKAMDAAWDAVESVCTTHGVRAGRDLITARGSSVMLEATVATTAETARNSRRQLDAKLAERARIKTVAEERIAIAQQQRGVLQTQIAHKEREFATVAMGAAYIPAPAGGYPSATAEMDAKLAHIAGEIADGIKQRKFFDVMELMADRYRREAEETHQCPLCRREFVEAEDVVGFEEVLDLTTSDLPEEIAKIDAKLAGLDAQQERLRGGRAVATHLDHLRQQMAALPDPAKEHEKLLSAGRAMQDVKQELDIADRELMGLDTLLVAIRDVVRAEADANKLRGDVDYLRNTANMAQSSKTMEEISTELGRLQEQREGLQRDLTKEITQMTNLQSDLSSRQSSLARLQQSVNDKAAALAQRDSIKAAIKKLNEDINQSRQQAEAFSREAREAHDHVDQLSVQLVRNKSESEQTVSAAQSVLDTLRMRVAQFNSVHDQVETIERSRPLDSMQRIEADLCAIKAKMDGLNADETQFRDDVAKIQLAINELSAQESNIRQNLEFRARERTIADKNQQLVDLEARIRDHDALSYSRQMNALQEQLSTFTAEKHRLDGERGQQQAQLERAVEDIEGEYKNAEKEYVDARVKVRVTDLVIGDLEQYAKALDIAIMKYHTLKMKELNEIIRELWVNTYKGNDIDAIEIRADKETRGARAFSYRVVMIKGDAELEMRGRCSAGQKVLSCLIIRLALAECFCLNCGVLALDEPTTNLDRANTEALAESLARILENRRSQVNFQLIVITHDEEFMRLLGRAEYADYYWNVSKDENQHSVVERVAIQSRAR